MITKIKQEIGIASAVLQIMAIYEFSKKGLDWPLGPSFIFCPTGGSEL